MCFLYELAQDVFGRLLGQISLVFFCDVGYSFGTKFATLSPVRAKLKKCVWTAQACTDCIFAVPAKHHIPAFFHLLFAAFSNVQFRIEFPSILESFWESLGYLFCYFLTNFVCPFFRHFWESDATGEGDPSPPPSETTVQLHSRSQN